MPHRSNPMPPPIHIRIKPTNICNHNCRYCAYRAEGLQLGQDMNKSDSIPEVKMMEIVDDIIAIGVKAVTFSGGGEPLLYPYLTEVLRLLADSPVKFAALTNGAQLQDKTAELFAFHGTWMRVSMDGWNDASYSEYRGVKSGEFTKVMDNMRSFKELGGKCLLGVSFIVDRKNANHVHEFIGEVKSLGLNSIKISPCIVSNQAAQNNEYHRSIFPTVKKQILQAKEVFQDATFEIFDAFHELSEKFEKKYTWCPYSQILPVIGADQNIYPCQDKAYNLKEGVIGSIKEQRFREFWENNKKAFFTIDPSKHCNHHCVANEKNQMLQDYLSADPEHLMFV